MKLLAALTLAAAILVLLWRWSREPHYVGSWQEPEIQPPDPHLDELLRAAGFWELGYLPPGVRIPEGPA